MRKEVATLLMFAVFFCASCNSVDTTPVIAGAPSRGTPPAASAGPGESSRPEDERPHSAPGTASSGPGQTQEPSGSGPSGASMPPGVPGVSSGALSGESSRAASSAGNVSSVSPAARAEIADVNLRRYLNTKYFGRPGDAVTQPFLQEMQSLSPELCIPDDQGVKSLRGIESAVNIRLLDVRYNPVESLSDVDWSCLTKLRQVILLCSRVCNLDGVNWIAANLESLTLSGDESTAAYGALSSVTGPDWSRFTALRTLCLHYNRISDPAPLNVAFPALERLNLDFNDLGTQASGFRKSFLQKNPGTMLSIFQQP